MANRDDDFLARWSRRKAEARGGLRRRQDADGPRPAAAPPSSRHGITPGDRAPQRAASIGPRNPVDPELSFADELRREEEAPVSAVNRTPAAHEDEFDTLTEEQRAEFADVDFDKLTPEDDFTRFMKEGVPEIIRRRALRALWSHPIISSVDRLNDYDQDFTDAAMAIKIVGSNYKPGSGYLTEEERARYNLDEGEAPDEVAKAPSSDEDEAKAAETEEPDEIGDGEGGEEFPSRDDADDGDLADAGPAGTGGRAPEADEKS
jgi:hypothetical protein